MLASKAELYFYFSTLFSNGIIIVFLLHQRIICENLINAITLGRKKLFILTQ